MVEFHLAYKILHMVEMFFLFAGKAGDECGAQGDSRNALADLIQHHSDSGLALLAFHPLQHEIVGVLQGHINIRTNLVQPGNGIEQVVVDKGRITIKQPYPFDALNRHE